MSKEKVKILILGLSNSGKTCISLLLQKNINLLSFISLKPTKGIERSIFEDDKSQYIIWDFGGQDLYRAEYMNRFTEYINGTDDIIFVIDVQNIEEHHLALEYLEEIVKILIKENIKVNFSVYLHKFDLDYKPDEEIIKKLNIDIKEKFPGDIEFEIFNTNIYAVLHKRTTNF